MEESALAPMWAVWGQFICGVIAFIGFWSVFDQAVGDWYFSSLTDTDLVLVDIAYLLLPLGWLLFQSALSRLVIFQPASLPSSVTIGFTLLCCIVSGVIAFVFFFEWDVDAWIDMDENATQPARIVQGIALFFIMIAFHIVLALVLVRLWMFSVFATGPVGYEALDTAGTGGASEATGLLDVEQTDSTAAAAAGTGKERRSSYGSVITPVRAAEEKVFERFDRVQEYAYVLCFFLIVLPLLLILNGFLPSDWHKLCPSSIESYLSSSSTAGWVVNVSYEWRGDTYYMLIYGDLIVFFGFLSVVGVVSWLAQKVVSVRMMLRKRLMIEPIGVSFTVGQFIFWFLWFWLMFVLIYYWLGVHLYESSDTKSHAEVWARFCGVLSIIFLVFMLFTVTRIRLWHDCFGLSSDHLVTLHQIFAYCMITLGYAHMFFWIAYFASDYDSYALTDNFIFVASSPFTYSSDNWTVPVIQVVMIFYVPIAYFVFSSSYVRRHFFEYFYIVHLYSAILMTVVLLWHASQAWRYLVPVLILYYLDRCLRFYNSCNLVRVDSLDSYTMPTGYVVTRLGFSVAQVDPAGAPDGSTRAYYAPLRFKMGQYCVINIPAISPLEWHPFTISSGPYDRQATFHIKSEGEEQFTGRLSSLADDYKSDAGSVQTAPSGKPLSGLECHIDGPYGIPFNYEGYGVVALVAGGIGITPCHSILSGLVSLARTQLNAVNNVDGLPSVHLIWLARDAAMFDLFAGTFAAARGVNEACGRDLFTFRLYHTKPSDAERGEAELTRPGTNIKYFPSRINTDAALRFLEQKDVPALVFCCGPSGLADDCAISASKVGAHYYAESFEFNKGNDIKLGAVTLGVLAASLGIMGAICDMY